MQYKSVSKKLRGMILPGLATLFVTFSPNTRLKSQTSAGPAHSKPGIGGDETEMSNNARLRDQKAIDDAMQGWWKSSMRNHDTRIRWWEEARFGMFIHWGIYSLPAGQWKGKIVGGYAEHLMRKEKITRTEYLDIAHHFNPGRFDADAWVKAASYAGMNYLIITAKHHDGFAMFDSKISDFNVLQQTPWRHDPMADLAAACKKYGVHFGFYYSHAFDWEDSMAPGNDWEYSNPGGDKNLFGGAAWYDVHPELLPRAAEYVDRKAIPQIRELIRKYHPDILWFDTPGKLPLSENLRILKAIREIDTTVVVNGRLARTSDMNFGDYKNTADRPAEFFPVEGLWEAIPTTNESYGYSKYDNSHKPAGFFIQLLARAAAKGGNLLLNIGPMGDGAFDPRDTAILHGIGDWISRNRESIYNTVPSGLPSQNWGVTTASNGRLYLHVFDWPADGKLYLGGLKTGITRAWILGGTSNGPSLRSPEGSALPLPKGSARRFAKGSALRPSQDLPHQPPKYLPLRFPSQESTASQSKSIAHPSKSTDLRSPKSTTQPSSTDPSESLTFNNTPEGDLCIHVPAAPPDTSNTVIALQLTGNLQSDTIAYIAPNARSIRMLAYDANLLGGGFGFGDGKRDRYYVEGWKSARQSVSWTFRTVIPDSFQMFIKYQAGSNAGGRYRWQLDAQKDSLGGELRVDNSDMEGKGSNITVQPLGDVTLPVGIHMLTITPVEIDKSELMKLFEVGLIPVHSTK